MYEDERYVVEEQSKAAANESGSKVNWPTVMMSAGIAAMISAIVLAIGMAGLMVSGVTTKAAVAEAPATVVNLGAQQQAPGAPAAPAAAPSSDVAPAPVAEVPADVPAPAPVPEATTAAQPTVAQASGPTTPTAAQLQADLDFLGSGASGAQKAQRLEGGSRAVNQAQGILGLAKRFKAMGLTYRIVDPVTVNGNTASARMKLASPGYDPTYMTLKWVWQDGRWKLTNASVCDLGSYASIPCNL
ncbi:hypothetical protein [Gordonia sp. (in: high G+C Gram-positive bacteria)]|uniref:hypothetical protein n=1 Tax=Gordonia sp. (in: high G+C Gram-positive bacteria) TaxID=84139 RepID=UPI003C76A4E6